MNLRRALVVVSVVALAMIGSLPVFAAESGEVAGVVAETGVYVEAGTSASEAEVSDYVAALRFEGEAVSMVVLADEPVGGATTFADAVYSELNDGIVVVVAPETVGWSGTSAVYTDVELEEALDAALDGEDDGDVLAVFTRTLTGEVVVTAGSEPEAASEPASSGGSTGWIWLLVIGGGIALFFWWMLRQRRTKGPRLDPRLAEAKEQVQKQIDAVANDIIDMEDEVRTADNAQVDEFYEAAGRTYNEVTDLVDEANTPQEVLDLSNKLDEAIWQLDSAEAVLDGKTPPTRPLPRTLPKRETKPAPAPAPSGSSLPPRPDYSRRPTRRSSYSSGGMMDILIAVGGAMMASRRRSRGGLFGTSAGRRVPPRPYPQVPASRSGSPVPSPSRPSSPSSSSRRRGSTGRSRGGGKRRRK